MRAIRIDPYIGMVEEIELDTSVSTYQGIKEALGVDLIDQAFVLGNRDVCFVDDEGLMKKPTHFFVYRHYPQPLAGRGLIVGTDTWGETVAAKTPVREIASDIRFATVDQVREWFRQENEERMKRDGEVDEDGFQVFVMPYPDL